MLLFEEQLHLLHQPEVGLKLLRRHLPQHHLQLDLLQLLLHHLPLLHLRLQLRVHLPDLHLLQHEERLHLLHQP